MDTQFKPLIEALLFIATEPLSPIELERVIGISAATIREIINTLSQEYDETGRGFQIKRMGQGYSIVTRPEFAEYIREFFQPKAQQRLTQAALETLAIIAYKQPITRAEIEEIRGVKVEKALITLQKRNLIKEMGRKTTIGTPIIYGTSDEFFRYFGLKDLSDLPKPTDLILYEQQQQQDLEAREGEDDTEWEGEWPEGMQVEALSQLQSAEIEKQNLTHTQAPDLEDTPQKQSAEEVRVPHTDEEPHGTNVQEEVQDEIQEEIHDEIQEEIQEKASKSTKKAKTSRRNKASEENNVDTEVAEQVSLF